MTGSTGGGERRFEESDFGFPQHDMENRQDLRNAPLLESDESRHEEPLVPPKWQRVTLRIRPACKRTPTRERKGVYYPRGPNKRYRVEVRIPGWPEKAWVGGLDTLGEAMIAVDLLRHFTGREHCHYDFRFDYVLRPTEPHLQPQAVGAYIKSLTPRHHGNNPPDLVTLRKEFISCLKKVVEDALYHGGQEEVEAPPLSSTASGSGSSVRDDVDQALADVVPPGKSDLELFPKLEEPCYMAPLPEASKKFLSPLEYIQNYQGSIEGVPD